MLQCNVRSIIPIRLIETKVVVVIIEHGRIRMVLRKVKKRKREKIDGARKCWCNRMSFIDKNIYINNICVQVLWLKRRQQLLRKSFFLRISGNGIKAISFILVSSTPCIYFSVGFFHLALLIFSLFHFSQHFFCPFSLSSFCCLQFNSAVESWSARMECYI